MIEMTVAGVRIEFPSNSPIVLLRETEGERFLPIWIGQSEAQAIAIGQQGLVTPRPMTHDLLKNILDEMSVQVTSITITELRDGVFHAVIATPGPNPRAWVHGVISQGAPRFATATALLPSTSIEPLVSKSIVCSETKSAST